MPILGANNVLSYKNIDRSEKPDALCTSCIIHNNIPVYANGTTITNIIIDAVGYNALNKSILPIANTPPYTRRLLVNLLITFV